MFNFDRIPQLVVALFTVEQGKCSELFSKASNDGSWKRNRRLSQIKLWISHPIKAHFSAFEFQHARNFITFSFE